MKPGFPRLAPLVASPLAPRLAPLVAPQQAPRLVPRLASRFAPLLAPLALALAAASCAPASPSAASSGVEATTPATPASTPPAGDEAALRRRLDEAVDRALAEERVVGAVVLVSRDGRLVYSRAAGLADREANRPMQQDAIFRLASVSKTLVSAAALALVDAGKLGLDDPVSRWLPEFRPKLADGREPTITVRQLLTHTSGLSYRFFEPEGGPYHRANVSDGLDQPGLSFAENARRLASVPLRFEPGKAWGYSLSIDVLGEVIARAGGAPLPQVVERTVTGPLGLRDTGFAVADPARLAAAYADGRPRPQRMGETHTIAIGGGGARFAPGRIFDPASYPSGGAGMAGTAGDVLAVIEAVRKGGGPILQAETARSMLRDQTGGLEAEPGTSFGFGGAVIVDPARAQTALPKGAWQWGGAYGHHWWVDPAARLSAVIFTNTAFEGMNGRFVKDVERAVYAP